ncbi:hypothetical protein ACQ4W0_04820 [Janthinobacterium sp. MDB2-8]
MYQFLLRYLPAPLVHGLFTLWYGGLLLLLWLKWPLAFGLGFRYGQL